jgi:hypothetical protein
MSYIKHVPSHRDELQFKNDNYLKQKARLLSVEKTREECLI